MYENIQRYFNQLFIDKLNLSIDNFQQILLLSTTFSMMDFDQHVTSCFNPYTKLAGSLACVAGGISGHE